MMRIGDRQIGAGAPAYVIAELSGNHNGSFDRAVETVRAAARAGVDAIKLQTYRADTITIDFSGPQFVVPGDGEWGGRRLYDLYDEAHTPWEWHAPLLEEARRLGLHLFSTPFDATAVDFLETLGVPAYKVASFELTDDALLEKIARTGKPMIVSTGMASLEEIAHAQTVIADCGNRETAFLKCTSSYPAPDAAMNLATLPLLATVTGRPVGLSDHSTGTTAAVVAVTLGAVIVEKHLTLSRADGGVDSHFSLEPAEFAQLVSDVRRAEAMIGSAAFGRSAAEEGNVVFRRSLYIVEDVKAGEPFTAANVRSIRPGYGLSPRLLPLVLGRAATRDVARGTPLEWSHLTLDPAAGR